MIYGDSPFLAIPASEWLLANDSGFVVADRFPVSPGHALVVPRRLIGTWWEATDQERADMLALVDEVKRQLDAERGDSMSARYLRDYSP
jgi:diadenosine tetraphosphate (Ap4A) HIT family hydrolase